MTTAAFYFLTLFISAVNYKHILYMFLFSAAGRILSVLIVCSSPGKEPKGQQSEEASSVQLVQVYLFIKTFLNIHKLTSQQVHSQQSL